MRFQYEIVLRHGCSPVNLLRIFRTPFLKNTSGRLLLIFIAWSIAVVLVSMIFKIGMQKMTLESDKRLAEMEMKAKLGQLIYLESLTKVSPELTQM